MTDREMTAAKPSLIKIGMWLSLAGGILNIVDAASATPNRRWQLLLAGVFMFLIAFGFKAERSWVRFVVLLYWIVLGLVAILALVKAGRPGVGYFIGACCALGIAFAVWYFFAKSNVVAYYRGLERAPNARRA